MFGNYETHILILKNFDILGMGIDVERGDEFYVGLFFLYRDVVEAGYLTTYYYIRGTLCSWSLNSFARGI